MRKIKSSFFISLDGVVESPDKWHFPYFNDEMGAAIGAGAAGVDAYLMGRVLYEEWAVRWLPREGVLDELHLLVHPIVVGAGMARLFPADEPQAPLKLLSSQPFETGVLYSVYAPAE